MWLSEQKNPPKWNSILLHSLQMHSISTYQSLVNQMLNVNWSVLLREFSDPLSYDWNNNTNGEHQLGGRDIKLLPLLIDCLCGLLAWMEPLCGHLLTSWLLQGSGKTQKLVDHFLKIWHFVCYWWLSLSTVVLNSRDR